jgi:hypothetical protein
MGEKENALASQWHPPAGQIDAVVFILMFAKMQLAPVVNDQHERGPFRRGHTQRRRERNVRVPVVPPNEGNEARREGRQEVAVP